MSSRPRRGLLGRFVLSLIIAVVQLAIDVAIVAAIIPHRITAVEGLGLFAAVVGSMGLIAAAADPARRHFIPISVKIARTSIGLLSDVMATTLLSVQPPRNWGRVLTGHPGTGSRGGSLLALGPFCVGTEDKYTPRGRSAQARRQIWPAASESLLAGPGLIMSGA